MAGRTLTTTLAALAMVASACGTPADNASESAPPPPPTVRDVRSDIASNPDDGLQRVIVTVPLGGEHHLDTLEDTTETFETPDVIGEVESNGATNPLLREELLSLPEGSTLVIRDGVLGYVDDSGNFVSLNATGPADDAQVDFEQVDDIEDVLRSVAGVESVQPITESTFAVATTSVEALEALGVELSEDAPLAFTADPYEPYQWALANTGDNLSGIGLAQPPAQSPDADIDGVEASPAATGRGIVVAVIDSGVDFSHPDLAHARWVHPSEDCGSSANGVDDDANGYIDDCHGWDFGDNDATPYGSGDDEHGTHVAGIIAARSNNGIGISGIAPDVQIMDLKVSDSSGAISSSAIARAIRYAADNGADVANLSLGTNPGASLASVAAIADAVEYAGTKGLLLVAAAGNSSVSLDRSPVYPASFDAAHLLTVGASTASDTRASFSNTGSAIELFAPGDLILSTIPGGDVVFMSGTSQASPIAAATAALMLERDRSSSPAALIDQMVLTGDRLDSLEGLAAHPIRLNAARAVGIEADIPGVDDEVTIRGLAADADGLVSAQITIGELGGQLNQPYQWEASLVALVDGEPFAVTSHPVTVRDVDGDELWSGQTDGRGAVVLTEGDATSAGWSTTLPNGSYALLVEAVPTTDPTVRLGDRFIARFDVGQSSTGESSGAASEGGQGADGGDGDTPTGGNGAAPDPDGSADPDSSGDSGSSGGAATGDSGSGSNTPDGSGSGDAGSTGGGIGASDDALGGGGAGGGGSTPGQGTTGDSGSTPDVADPSSGAPADEGDAPGAGPGDPSAPANGDGPGSGASNPGVPLPPAEASNGLWSVTNVSPRSGPVDTRNLVVIDGTFPEEVVVWFGNSPGESVFQSPSSILVETPLYAAAETVDVNLRTRDEIVLTVPDGFAFTDALAPGSDVPGQSGGSAVGGGGTSGSVGDDGSSGAPSDVNPGPSSDSGTGDSSSGGPVSGDGSDGAGGTDGATGEEPAFDDDPEDVVDVDSPPPAGEPGDDDADPTGRNRQARANITGEPRALPNGLTGAPLSGLDTIGGVPACDEALCRTRRI